MIRFYRKYEHTSSDTCTTLTSGRNLPRPGPTSVPSADESADKFKATMTENRHLRETVTDF